MQGFLHKLGGGATTGQAWKRRYSVLRGSTLLYFPTQAAASL